MSNIIPLPILKSNYNDIPLVENQLIYCTDTLESYFDLNDKQRIQLSTTRQLSTEEERTSLSEAKEGIIYIVVSTNKLYKYSSAGWILISTKEDCTDCLYNAENLYPYVFKQGDINRAPLTLASLVFNPDGSTVQDTINSLMKNGKKITIQKKVLHVFIDYDQQRIINIPFPTSNYDIYKFPVMIILNKTLLDIDEYAIGSEQLILNNDVAMNVKKGDKVTFIFAWANMNMDEGVNADSIDSCKMSIGDHEPVDPTEHQFWYQLHENKIKYWEDGKWKTFIDNNATTVKWQKNSKIVTKSTNFITIDIDGFNKNYDKLLVFENSIFLDEGTDYTISGDNTGIYAKSGDVWEINNEKTYFVFIVLKNVPAFNINTDELPDREYSQSEIEINNLKNIISQLSEKINLLDIIKVNNIDELNAIEEPLSDKLYLVLDTYTLYVYDGTKWVNTKGEIDSSLTDAEIDNLINDLWKEN